MRTLTLLLLFALAACTGIDRSKVATIQWHLLEPLPASKVYVATSDGKTMYVMFDYLDGQPPKSSVEHVEVDCVHEAIRSTYVAYYDKQMAQGTPFASRDVYANYVQAKAGTLYGDILMAACDV